MLENLILLQRRHYPYPDVPRHFALRQTTILVGNSPAAAAAFFASNVVVPVDYKLEVSQRLVDAALDGDLKTAYQCIIDPFVDVNFVGAVSLRSKRTEIVLCDERPHEVRVEYEEFRTEVTALFLAAHGGNSTLVRKLLSAGANVNQKLFKGYATTAAVREGHIEILEVLINAGAGQNACEEALLEASYVGHPKSCDLLMRSQMIRSQVAVRALVLASYRGFVDVVRSLITTGVDVNATNRVLLQSSKPTLHINVDCSALVAAIISRQVSAVRLLLQAGVRTDTNVRIGAWYWDINTGEEFRVAAGLAEPYLVTWCAVEYFESSGAILTMLLQHLSPNTPHCGRTLLHAILCRNKTALDVLLKCGADRESPIYAEAAKIKVIQSLTVNPYSCTVRDEDIIAPLAFNPGFVDVHRNCTNLFPIDLEGPETPVKCSESSRNIESFEDVLFSYKEDDSASLYALHCASNEGAADLVWKLIGHDKCDINVPDADGYTPLMLAAKGGHRSTCEFLISEGARCNFENARHETALAIAGKSEAEGVILNEMARKLVVEGEQVKHTKCGKGSPHVKMLRMVERSGVLSWGRSGRRNVVCRHAEVGPSPRFMWNRRRKSDSNEPGIFHVVTTRNKDVHFVCQGGDEIARLWVRGIKLLTRDAIFGGNY